MASPTESSLISILETSHSEGIFSLVSEFLHPFSDVKNPKKCKKSAKPRDTSSEIRSLAKKFLSFLNRALSILPKRLDEPSKLGNNRRLASELFEIYKLCLGCLECVSSQLSCKPYTVDVQRIRMVHCLENWGLYSEAEVDGFRILESLREIDRSSNAQVSGAQMLPDVDKDLGLLFVEVVVTLVKCAANGRSKDSRDYRRVLGLVEEVRPWFRVIDSKVSEKIHKALVTYLGKCNIFLVGELFSFDGDLVKFFCITTFAEYAKSPLKDQIYKFARSMCSTLFSLQQEQDTTMLIMDILTCVLKSIIVEWKDEIECTGVEFLQLIYYCVSKCKKASPKCCHTFARQLEELAGDFQQETTPLVMVLRLYAAGLKIFFLYPRGEYHGSTFSILVDNVEAMQSVANLNSFLGSYFCIGCKEINKHCSIGSKDVVEQPCTQLNSNPANAITSVTSRGEAYLPTYLDAFKFLCQHLAELVNSERKKVLAEDEAASLLYDIQNTFHQFCNVFLFCRHHARDDETDGSDENINAFISSAVAAFTLSFRTKLDVKRSTYFIKHIITSKWIQPLSLKHLFASLNNIGVILYRNNQVKEASMALKLCCSASWTYVIRICEIFDDKSKPLDNECSDDTILSFVNEAITRSAFVVDVLYQCNMNKCNMNKIEKTMAKILEDWSIAANLCNGLPIPVQLVKQWVKIQCKHNKNADLKESALTLSCLLPSSGKMSNTRIRTLLEQELVEYEEMSVLYPEFCQPVQMKIMSTLLEDVYVTPNYLLDRAMILMKKARTSRFCEVVCLDDCIQHLSEAISTMNENCGGGCSFGILHCHQLAVAYCLRALCTHEAELNSKQQVLQDIDSALSMWLNMSSLDSLQDDQRLILSEYMLLLLCNTFDLLSIKGCVEYYGKIYKLMFRLFEWKNVQLEKLLAILWESRRMSHALCVAPVNETIMAELTEGLGELPKSVGFWTRCLKGSPAMLVGFQQSFSFLCLDYTQSSCNDERSSQLNVTVDEIKDAASKLISHIPESKGSFFLAGYIYYDLCERLILDGCFTEALLCAKEAHQLRTKLFQERFLYSVEQYPEKYCETPHTSQKLAYGIRNLQMKVSVARKVWSFDKISWDLEGCYLSHLNVLQCYLESILQVALVHEIIGNCSEAEALLLWGKSIACLQSLPLFEVAFSSVLGKVYKQKQLWDLAQKELESARKILKNSNITACLKCRLVLEVIVDQHLGDLFRSMHRNAKDNTCEERLINAEELYKLSLEKLNLPAWKNTISCPEEESSVSLEISVERPKVNKNSRKCKNTTNAPQSFQVDQCIKPQSNARLTRSKCRSFQSQSSNNSNEVQVGLSRLKSNLSDCSSAFSQRELLLEGKSCKPTLGCETSCKNVKVRCWQCLPLEIMEAGLINNFIHFKWEVVRRRLLLRLHSGLGKCLGMRGQIHQTHETILKCMSVLVNRNLFFQPHPAVETTVLLNLVGKEVRGDMFAVERASVLYNICWFALKSYNNNDTGIICCMLCQIQLKTLVYWLMVALVLCCEVPVLFQKVSRLLAVLYVISSSRKPLSLSSNKILTESHWASYFHQASIGTHFNYQFFPYLMGRSCFQDTESGKGFCTGEQTQNVFRVGTKSSQDLEEYIIKFFEGLPYMNIICISMIGGDLASLLQQILQFPSSVKAWIFVSHLNSTRQPLVVLLPVETVLKEASDDYLNLQSDKFCERNDMTKHWQCPWGSSVIDEVAPAFRIILEENYLSSSVFPLEDTKTNRMLWWKRRTKLDDSLGKLLGTIEDSWLGPWKYLLLGDLSNRTHMDFVLNKLVLDLKSKCKVEINESLLKVVLQGSEEVLEAVSSDLCSRKGCYIGRVGYHDQQRSNISQTTLNGVDGLSELALKFITDAKKELEREDNTSREPIIFVLDYDVQMLPWENIPVLKNQEVYRMPSVGSICATLDGRCHQQEQVGGIIAAFPSIDPLDAFYLLNPSGDLSSTQAEFENWFKDKNLEGKAGYAPTPEELIEELKSHDLFIYLGHGSGAQYIPRHEIQKLDACAASLLMGCSSGSLTLNGCYVPQGIPLSYLKARSPIIVANLWEVTDKDIDRFGKAILEAWLRERSYVSSSAQCNIITKELEDMKISKRTKKKVPTKNLHAASESESSNSGYGRSRMVGSFLCEARRACNLRYLIGASPVCYGVPTGIRKKKDL